MDTIDEMMSRIPVEKFQRIYLETDMDPEDEKTPGWTAGVLFKEEDDGTFFGCYRPTRVEAVSSLIEELIQQGWM